MLQSNIVGFYLPTLFAIIAFAWLVTSKDKHDHKKRYGIYYLISIAFAIQLPFYNIGGWSIENDGIQQVKFISIFPLMIILHTWYQYRKTKQVPKLSVAWLCLGSFSSDLLSDFLMAYHSFDSFRFSGIGGAGWYDGLLIITLIVSLSGWAINYINAKSETQSTMRFAR